jgi:hypothetical protein
MVDVILLPVVAALVPFTVTPFSGVPIAPPDSVIDSSTVAPPPTCATYSIEGSLDGAPNPQSDADVIPQLEISATAYLHDGGDPLAGHRVTAVFEMADGAVLVDPVETVTDADGRVSILLPVGAIGVSFRAESAAIGDCSDVAPGDVPVVVVDVPVLPPDFGQVGMVGDTPAASSTPSTLPDTGPRENLVLVAGLVLAAGLGTAAARARHRAEEPGVVPR